MVRLQASPVADFHHHDEFGPVQLFMGQYHFGIVSQSGGVHLQLWPGIEHLLGGGAAQTVAAAQKQYAASHQAAARYSFFNRT